MAVPAGTSMVRLESTSCMMLTTYELNCVVAERHESKRHGSRVANAVDTSTFGVNNSARFHRHFAHGQLAQAIDVHLFQRVSRAGGHGGIVAFTHVRDSFALEDIVQLLGADMPVGSFDATWRDGDLVKVYERRPEFLLQEPAHFYDVVV